MRKKKIGAFLLTVLLAAVAFPAVIWAGSSLLRYGEVQGENSIDGISVNPSEHLVIFQQDGLFGCSNMQGGLICEAKYENITGTNGFVLAVEPNGNHTLFDYDGQVRMSASAFKKAMTGGYEVNSSSIGENIVGLYKVRIRGRLLFRRRIKPMACST